MAGMTQVELLARAIVVLTPVLGAAGGGFRTTGPDLCPSGH